MLQGIGSELPRGQYESFVQLVLLAGVTQNDPASHAISSVDLAGQYDPRPHAFSSSGDGQNEPDGQALGTLDPSAQNCPTRHDDLFPPLQYHPFGQITSFTPFAVV